MKVKEALMHSYYDDEYEAFIHYSINDFMDLIDSIGFDDSMSLLFSRMQDEKRELTEAERIKMIDLLTSWEY